MRSLRLRAAALGLAVTGVLGLAVAHPAPAASRPGGVLAVADTERRVLTRLDADPRFTVAVIPDTQYLFDGDRGDAAPLDATLRYLGDQRIGQNIRFTAALGDITENGDRASITRASRVYRQLDQRLMPWSVLAGNHDVPGRTDDTRGRTEYLAEFGPRRFAGRPGYLGSDPSGYSAAHAFRAAGRDWMVLALDWRLSDAGYRWAQSMIEAHPAMPVILTTHDLAAAGPQAGQPDATVTAYGEQLWNRLITRNDQIFLAIGGHNWPSDRTVRKNSFGHDVHLQVTDYQDRYYGGSGMVRLYHVDAARGVIDVETKAPYWLGTAHPDRGPLGARETELTGPDDRFSLPIDLTARFASFTPGSPARPVPAARVLVPGTMAYWRFDTAPGTAVRDLTGRGNDLAYRELPGTPAGATTWTADRAPLAPGAGSLRFTGTRNPGTGGWFETGPGAPLNRAALTGGYTVEAFVKLPQDIAAHAWMGVLSRSDSGRAVGKTGDDPDEPAAVLAVSGSAELQWAAYPAASDAAVTNWSHQLAVQEWHHIALVNDGRRTVMYVDGQRVLRNPAADAIGLATAGGTWRLGAGHYAGVVEQGFHGAIGDVRIVARPLSPAEFLTAR